MFSQFRRWRLMRPIGAAHGRLRRQVREVEGGAPEPATAILDSQSVRTTGVGGPARGCDGGKKKAKARKRHLLVDAGGLVLLAYVHAANLRDRAGAEAVVGAAPPTALQAVRLVWGDRTYAGASAERLGAERGRRLEAARHPGTRLWRHGLDPKPKSRFRVLPRRWVIGRTFAELGQSRRLARDCQHLPETAETMIYGAVTRLMLKRLARDAASCPARRAHAHDF